ncbi:MAG: protein-disulfide reductase DsbD N-terminal domain-containing protein [Acidobacteria bacterium]|nr:protein-disulfide reductase DsbD N-terminal domain-containing protein [Acidobacteriota bacterium]MCI0621862.1 protein-disulfide reductase DsbD N-terminal domain-containing protein [Acidobacteriota bacterium]MCI0717788.1 protein-disulfide reductase DsbD N-terminal domain-containing protein [Acidobacteriota bacterium]
MIKPARQTVLKAMILFSLACAEATYCGDWTNPAEVRHDVQRCVSYRAKLSGEFLVIQATHEAGWHTYALDNKQRAQEKLAGKRSLGIDRSTEIGLTEGLELAGPWYQSPPKDLSKPELRWYSWGFEGQVLFVAKVRRLGAGPARITVRGQACAEATCKNIDLAISVPLAGARTGAPDIDFKTLIQVH